MKTITRFTFCFLLFHLGFSQNEFKTAQPLKIESKKPTALELHPEKKPTLSLPIPDLIGEPEEYQMKNYMKPKISMLPNKDLIQAGADLKLDAKIGDAFGANSGKHFPDMYMGDIKYNGKFVGIVCRDHEFVDGDQVRILLNGEIVEPKIFLTGAFKGLNVDLKRGFNRIEFEALNEGSSSPNTAQINVYDDEGKLLYANQWNLSTGSKASFIVVKE